MTQQVLNTNTVEKKKRKERSDKGKKRGPRKQSGQTEQTL